MKNTKGLENRVKYCIAIFLSLTLMAPFLLTSTFAYDDATVEETTSTGSTTIYYQDAATSKDLIEPDSYQNLEYQKYVYSAKDIQGFKLWGDSSKSVTLTESHPNQSVTFLYYKSGDSAYNGEVSIEYRNAITGKNIKEKVVNKGVHVFDFDITDEVIKGYNFSKRESKLMKTDAGISLSYINYYTPIEEVANTGEVIINCYDEAKNLLKSETKSNLELKKTTVQAPILENFNVVGEPSKTVELTEIQPKVTVDFIYKYAGTTPLPTEGKAIIVQMLDDGKTELGRVTVDKLPLGRETTVDAPGISGYSPNVPSVKVMPTIFEPTKEVVITYTRNNIGTITIKYVEKISGREIAQQDVQTGLAEGKHEVKAKAIKGYTIQGDGVQSVNITADSPNQTVTFYYTANEVTLKGSVIIHYLDKDNKEKIKESKVITNLEMGMHSFDAPMIEGYTLSDEATKSITLTSSNREQELFFLYNKNTGGDIIPDPENPPVDSTDIEGSVIINYVDEDGNKLLDSENFTGLKAGNYSFSAVAIEGYRLIGNDRVFFVLNKDNPTKTITFKYSKLSNPGKLNIRYIDKDTGANLLSTKVYNNLALGTYSYEAELISGYSLVSKQKQTITLNDSKTEGDIVFVYARNTPKEVEAGNGKVTIKYIDAATGEEISTPEIIENLAYDEYTYSAITIEGYELKSDIDKVVTLTSDNAEQEIVFEYTKTKSALRADNTTSKNDTTNLPNVNSKKISSSRMIKIALAATGGVLALSAVVGIILKIRKNRNLNDIDDVESNDDEI